MARIYSMQVRLPGRIRRIFRGSRKLPSNSRTNSDWRDNRGGCGKQGWSSWETGVLGWCGGGSANRHHIFRRRTVIACAVDMMKGGEKKKYLLMRVYYISEAWNITEGERRTTQAIPRKICAYQGMNIWRLLAGPPPHPRPKDSELNFITTSRIIPASRHKSSILSQTQPLHRHRRTSGP